MICADVKVIVFILFQENKNYSNGTNVMLVLYHTYKELNNSLEFMFVWYDTVYFNDYFNGTKFMFIWYHIIYIIYHIIWHNLMINITTKNLCAMVPFACFRLPG